MYDKKWVDLLKAINNYEEILLFGVGNINEEDNARKELIEALKIISNLLKQITQKYDIIDEELEVDSNVFSRN